MNCEKRLSSHRGESMRVLLQDRSCVGDLWSKLSSSTRRRLSPSSHGSRRRRFHKVDVRRWEALDSVVRLRKLRWRNGGQRTSHPFQRIGRRKLPVKPPGQSATITSRPALRSRILFRTRRGAPRIVTLFGPCAAEAMGVNEVALKVLPVTKRCVTQKVCDIQDANVVLRGAYRCASKARGRDTMTESAVLPTAQRHPLDKKGSIPDGRECDSR